MKVLGKLFTKQAVITGTLIIFVVTITMFSSYAIYFKIDPEEISKPFLTNNLRVSFSNNGYDKQINISKFNLVSDEEIIKNEQYHNNIISIFNKNEQSVRYKLYLKNTSIEDNFITDKIDFNKLIARKYIKYQINDEEIKTLTDEENEAIYIGSVEGNNDFAKEINIKVWISNDLPKEQENYSVHLNLIVEEMPRNFYGEEDSIINTIINKTGGIAKIESKIPSKFSLSAIENEGLFITKDNDGNSIYYRGSVVDNNLIFGKNTDGSPLNWKIVRINGDKSLRIILNEEHIISEELLKSSYNDIDASNAFVGYSFGLVTALNPLEVHSNKSFSKAKINLEKWYEKTFVNTIYNDYILDSSFCNDRQIINGSGLGRDKSYYAPYKRIDSNIGEFNPSLLCNLTNDNINQENSLIYPIGLLTADELVFAGATSNVKNSLFYLTTKYNYWLMSPALYDNGAYVYLMSEKSGLIKEKVSKTNYLRPVINIKGDMVVLSGDGTIDNPYLLNINEMIDGK